MGMALRFLVPLLLLLGGIAWATTPLLGELIAQWLRADVEMRSQLVFDSIQDTVVRNATVSDSRRIDGLFQRVARDERLLAVGLCSPEGRLIHPYDHGAMAEAMHRGLLMAPEQRRERMHLMRAMVSENNVYFWAGRMLLEAARLRKRQHLEEQIDRVTAPFGRRSRGNAG